VQGNGLYVYFYFLLHIFIGTFSVLGWGLGFWSEGFKFGDEGLCLGFKGWGFGGLRKFNISEPFSPTFQVVPLSPVPLLPVPFLPKILSYYLYPLLQ